MKGIWDEILGQEAEAKDQPYTSESELGIDQILSMRLSELSRRNIALRIYSEVLGCEIWLCDNGTMAAQIRQHDPGAVTYTVNELRKLYKLQPFPNGLRAIHGTKAIFDGSRIIDSKLRADSESNEKRDLR